MLVMVCGLPLLTASSTFCTADLLHQIQNTACYGPWLILYASATKFSCVIALPGLASHHHAQPTNG